MLPKYFLTKKVKNRIIICNDLSKLIDFNNDKLYVLIGNFKVLKKISTNKSLFLIIIQNNKLYFLKKKGLNYKNEILGYKMLKDYYKVSSFQLDTVKYLAYEFLDDFRCCTLNDYFYGKSSKNNLKILYNSYLNSLNNSLRCLKQFKSNSYGFFNRRLQLISKCPYTIRIHDKDYELNRIISETKKIIKKSKDLYCFISNGDPTDTNITSTGFVTDFEKAGYNSVVGEIAILFISLFSHGCYFYPKYNAKSYYFNTEILGMYDKMKPSFNYKKENNKIIIDDYHLRINNKSKEVLLNVLKLFLDNDKFFLYANDMNYLKSYIIMRLLTPINPINMEENDQIIIYILICIVYEKVNDLKGLIKIINEMEDLEC